MATEGSKNELIIAQRRLEKINKQLNPLLSDNATLSCNYSSGKVDNKYRKIHGEVDTREAQWRLVSMHNDDSNKDFVDIIYEKSVGEGIAKITINRPERRNAFRPQTIKELIRAFDDARDDSSIGVIVLTGKGTKAFCSGGDQTLRSSDGYTDFDSFGRLNVLDLQFSSLGTNPSPSKASYSNGIMLTPYNVLVCIKLKYYILRVTGPVSYSFQVAGYSIGGGHILHMVCDLTIAADNAVFGQTGPKVGSFDAGYGSSIMSRLVGPKKAREMWFLSRFYDAYEAEKMGLVNIVVPLEKLEQVTLEWCREILRNSPTAIRVLKSALNAVDDGHAGLQELGGNATFIFYGTEEAKEGKDAYVERRRPDFSRFPRRP